MRIVLLAAPAALMLTLAACAATGGTNPHASEVERLAADCRARGGILTPSGENTGRPQVDNVCRISGEPSSRVDR